MTQVNKIYILFSVLAILFVNTTCAVKSSEDNFYICIVNNTSNKFPALNKYHRKRQENVEQIVSEDNQFIFSLVDEMHNIIVDNKDTFKNITKFESIEEESNLEKRDSDYNYAYDYGDSNYVYPIASTEELTYINAYLSNEIVKKIEALDGIVICTPNVNVKQYINRNNEILNETKWKSMTTKQNVPIQLSLISQGVYNSNLIGEYDNTYYYPTSAGKGVDVYIIDYGFNFSQAEFKNSNREQKCISESSNGKVKKVNKNVCEFNNDRYPHGLGTTSLIAGKYSGVANNANIYGLNLQTINISDLIASIGHVSNLLKENPKKKNKAVINLSLGVALEIGVKNALDMDKLVDNITDNGGIVIAAAGNDGANIKKDGKEIYPCSLGNVICVGGAVDVDGPNSDSLKPKSYKRNSFSNYGNKVELYAPGHAVFKVNIENGEISNVKNFGTSFSSAIVSGMAAAYISEYSNVKFDKNQMYNYLKSFGIRNAVADQPGTYFVNNGKKGVLSKNNKYKGCGINSGYLSCSNNQCCANDGKCYKSSDSKCTTKNGCQVDYGYCQIVNSNNADGKCGMGYGSCKTGNCCSKYGYCGTTNNHCGMFCQNNFGHCN